MVEIQLEVRLLLEKRSTHENPLVTVESYL